VTMKPSQQGRGLGLFVVRQLLNSMDSSITLTPDRNSAGRRYQLRLNFVQALSKGGG
jgi:C4-dicarboxylate-specific signal transduction histidine kinase